MTQEEKQLLLVDLCARLPYGTICLLSANGTSITEELKLGGLDYFMSGRLEVIPYLRPMSSMTEEEKGELWFLLTEGRTNIELNSNGQLTTKENIELGFNYPFVCPEGSTLYVDWLNANHIDYRGLIESGLALEVTEENNPYD